VPSAWALRKDYEGHGNHRESPGEGTPIEALKGPTLPGKGTPEILQKKNPILAGKDHGNPGILRHTHTIANDYAYDYKVEMEVVCPLFLVFEPSRKRSYPMYWGGSRWMISTIISYMYIYYDIPAIPMHSCFYSIQILKDIRKIYTYILRRVYQR